MPDKIDDFDRDILRHMVGATKPSPKKIWGYRNYFCAGATGRDRESLNKMLRLGLVSLGGRLNDGSGTLFHCTLEGCKAAGLHKAAIERALEDLKPIRERTRNVQEEID